MELEVALDAVRHAAQFSERVSAAMRGADAAIKADCSPVTVADYGVQAIIQKKLNHAFPGDLIVAEEEAGHLEHEDNRALMNQLLDLLQYEDPHWTKEQIISQIGRGGYNGGEHGRFWALDPIDGTKGFIRGDQYAIALALIENGKPVLGVLGCPRLSLPGHDFPTPGTLCYSDGKSSYAESLAGSLPRELHVSNLREPRHARISESLESGHSSHGTSAAIAGELGIAAAPVRMDSQAKYAAVASGMADLYLRLPTKADYREKIWDHAAGALLVITAGGTVGDVSGVPLDFGKGKTLASNRGVIASAPGIYDNVVEVVSRYFA